MTEKPNIHSCHRGNGTPTDATTDGSFLLCGVSRGIVICYDCDCYEVGILLSNTHLFQTEHLVQDSQMRLECHQAKVQQE